MLNAKSHEIGLFVPIKDKKACLTYFTMAGRAVNVNAVLQPESWKEQIIANDKKMYPH